MRAYLFTFLLVSMETAALADKSTFVLRIQSVNTGFLDDATIYFDATASQSFFSPEDELKSLPMPDGVPALYSYATDGSKCSKNGFGNLTTSEIVPLGIEVGTNGNYKFSAQVVNGFDPTCIIRLEDRQLAIFTNLRMQDYQASLNTMNPDSGRFFIHVTHAAVFTYENSGCQNNEGSITVTIDSSVPWDVCQLYDTANNPLSTITNVNPVANFTGLPQGDYYVAFLTGIYSSGRYFHLGGNYVSASIQAPSQTIIVNQPVTFHAVATNSTQYEWDFGDGTLITGVAHPPMIYYAPGTYTVNLLCSNAYGCSSTSEVTVTVELSSSIEKETEGKICVTAREKAITIEREASGHNATIKIYNLIGAEVYCADWNTERVTVDLGEQSSGYYMLSIKAGTALNTRRVYLGR